MGDHGHIKFDPAMDRWAAMRENVYQHFRFTRTATKQVAVWGLIFPATIAAVAWTYDAKYDWAGKLRGQSLLAKAPAAAPVDEE